MEERIRDGLVKGIKLYPGYDRYAINDPSLETVFRIAAKYDVPVMIHCGDTFSADAKVRMAHPLLVDDVAVDYPDVRLVICHLGNPWLVDCMEVVYKNKNVYADFSGLILGEFTEVFEDYMEEQIAEVILYAGDPARFLYGSDWPICDMKSYVDFVSQLKLAPAHRHAIMYENARRLFKLPLPAAPPSEV
ncbi:MAG: amidohydrolase family protein, partial [Gemmatimonadales bacterium]|nr:amidohydrolase family protein [Gemmatimonadales bacterium]